MENGNLYHHGILGQKWGVRRFQKKGGGLTEAGKKRYSDKENTSKSSLSKTKKSKMSSSTSQSSKPKKLKDLTNEELQNKISRLKMEKEYKSLLKDTDATARGKAFALNVVEKIGENVLVNIGTQAGNKALGVAINKLCKVDSKDAVNRIVNPNKGQTEKK